MSKKLKGTFSLSFFYVFRAYMGGKTYKSAKSMQGKVVIITGANTGIGFEVALDMAQRGLYHYLFHRHSFIVESEN